MSDVLSGDPPFKRWRDVGGRGRMAPSRLFRSGRLSKYSASKLLPLFEAHRIKVVVDLRRNDEDIAERYPPEVLAKVRHIRIPVDPQVIRTPIAADATEDARFLHMYEHLLEEPEFKAAARLFAEVIEDSANLPAVVHCHAGIDRTGMLLAMVLDLVGASPAEIEEDYIISGSHVKSEYIRGYLRRLSEFGGARGYLLKAGVMEATIDRVLLNLTSKNE